MDARRGHPVRAEALESRRLLALVTWDGGGDGTLWFDPLNWSNDVMPGPEDDVVISVPGDVTVWHNGPTLPVRSLICDERLTVTGILNVLTTADVNGPMRLTSGSLRGGVWDVRDGAFSCDGGTNRLMGGADVVGDLLMGGSLLARLLVEAGCNFDSIRMTAPSDCSLSLPPGFVLDGTISADGPFARIALTAPGTLTVAPTGAIAPMNGEIGTNLYHASPITLINNGLISMSGEITGPAFVNNGTVRVGTTTAPASCYVKSQQFTNNGTLEAHHALTQVRVEGQWTNAGTFRVAGAAMFLEGTVRTADMGTLRRDGGGSFSFETIDNTGSALVLDDDTGSWAVTTIFGGTLEFRNGHQVTRGRLRDVGVLSPLTPVNITVEGSTRFPSATLNGSAGGNDGILALANNYVLRDPVTMNNGRLLVEQFGIARIGIGTTVTGSGVIGATAGPPTIINQGLIEVTGAGVVIQTPYLNQGVVRTVGAARVEVRRLGINESVFDTGPVGTFELYDHVTHDHGGHITGAGVIHYRQGTHNVSGGLAAFAGDVRIDGSLLTVNFAQPLPPLRSLTIGGVSGSRANLDADMTLDFPVTLGAFATLGGAGNVTFSDVLTWTAGSMVGPGVTDVSAGAVLDMSQVPPGGSGSAERNLGRALRVAGTATARGGTSNYPPALVIHPGGRIDVQAGGTLDLVAGRILGTAGAGSAIDNAGTLTLAGADAAALLESVVLNNAGVLNVGGAGADVQMTNISTFNNTGPLNFLGGSLRLVVSGGTSTPLHVPAGASLSISGAFQFIGTAALGGGGDVALSNGTFAFAPGQFAITGSLAVESGIATIADPLTLASLKIGNGGSVRLDGATTLGQLMLQGQATLDGDGEVIVTNQLTWSSGTIQGVGGITIESAASTEINAVTGTLRLIRRLVNFGTWNQVNRFVSLGDLGTAGRIENRAGATFTLGPGAALTSSSPFGSRLENAGTVRRAGGTGGVSFSGVQLINSGVLRVESGSLTLASGGRQVPGALADVAAAGASLTFGGAWTHEPGSRIAGAGTVSFAGGSHDVDRLDLGEGHARIENGAVLRLADPAPRTGSLTLNAGSRATLLAGAADKVWVTRSLAVTAGSQLDLADNAMVVDYAAGGPSPVGAPSDPNSIFGMIRTGYANGAWNGPGIISSAAAADARTAIGFGEATDVFATFPATFMGQPVDDTAVLLRHTLRGDATLDGQVNLADFNRLAANFGQPPPRTFTRGDFDYDGLVNLADFNVLAGNFGATLGRARVTGADRAGADESAVLN